MKRVVVVIVFLTVANVIAAQSTNQSLSQEFIRLQRAEDEAEAKKDLVALDRILNDDFIFIAANGSISDKKKFLDEIKRDESSDSSESLSYEDFKVRVHGNTAIVNYVLLVSGKDKNGKDYANRFRISVMWVKQQRDWRMSNFHSTRVRP